MSGMTLVFILLVVYQLKHYLADYLLQTEYMPGKFKERGWFVPLASHCGIHAAMTAAICMAVKPEIAILMACLDFGAHLLMDRIKASPDMLGRWTPMQRPYWLILGVDQAFHHLTHYVIISNLVGYTPWIGMF